MRSLLLSIIAGFVLALAFGVGDAKAYTPIKNNWLAAYPDACPELVTLANECLLCHPNAPSYSVKNQYALDYLENGDSWAAIESIDSDGDGRTNIEEIDTDCTNPGDILSTGNNDETWARIKALFDEK